MHNTSDVIELFLKELISQQNGELELKRNELAVKFNCAPSQINYVLATRFNTNKGYIVTSRKGGGGYIRITSVDMTRNEYILHIINSIGDAISEAQAMQTVTGLMERGIVTQREALLIARAVKDCPLMAPEAAPQNRAALLKSMISTLME
ncbi:MAG: CtsR family transcriptional regulator [Clostridia bacterium]|nr:CtsR family transcriptional regulator [Clostridia bacterium]